MGNSKINWFLLQKICTRKYQSVTKRSVPTDLRPGAPHKTPGSYCRTSLKVKSITHKPEESTCNPDKSVSICIYRVPFNIHQVEPKAYNPTVISIGPYHHRASHLQEMERVKWAFFNRLFDPKHPEGIKLDPVIEALQELEMEARGHYSEEVNLSSDKFIEMMLLDGSFIVELLRELEKYNFRHGSPLIARWMLPALRRDLIMLENQLPWSILQKLFQLTSGSNSKGSNASLQELAIQFFTPLLQRGSITIAQPCQGTRSTYTKGKHFLDLFRSSILPRMATEAETNMKKYLTTKASDKTIKGEETDMIHCIKELEKGGMKFKKGENCQPLDVRYEKCKNELIIPPLYIDDYRGTLFRNMVAFEQCHHVCKPQVTAYLFFLDGLINCIKDVKSLYDKRIIQHSLGSEEAVAELFNNICKEVGQDEEESYLQQVLQDANSYMKSPRAQFVAPVLHLHFGNREKAITTILPFLASFLAYIIQAIRGSGNADAPDAS